MAEEKQKFRAFLFDAGGVLLNVEPEREELYYRVLCSMNLKYERDDVQNALKRMVLTLTRQAEQDPQCQFNFDIWSRSFVDHLEPRPDQAESLAKAINSRFLEEISLHPNEEAYPVLTVLSQSQIPLGVVSNWDASLCETLRNFDLLDCFKAVIASEEVGYSKPHPMIFRMMLNELSIEKEATAYIGDCYCVDVIGARRAGIEPILYDPKDQHPDADCIRIHSLAELPRFVEPD